MTELFACRFHCLCRADMFRGDFFVSVFLTECPKKQLIYLGYPNYWGDMPMAVYTFLENFDWNGKVIHSFCTHEGSGLSGTEDRIRNTCKGATVTGGLAIHGSSADHAGSKVKKWV